MNFLQPKRYFTRKSHLHWRPVAAFLFLVLFYAWPLVGGVGKYVSPDETANSFFAHAVARQQTLTPVIPFADEIGAIRPSPRSVGVIRGRYVPLSFAGLPLIVGSVGAIAGEWAIPFVVPVLSALAVFAFYHFISKIFSRPVARLSAILLAVMPSFWYFTVRGMMHNVVFVDFLVIGAAIFSHGVSKNKKAASIVGALVAGSSLMIRPAEFLWVSSALFTGLMVARSHLRLRTLFVACGFFFLPIFLLALFNLYIYGTLIPSIGVQNDLNNRPGTDVYQAAVFTFFLPFGADAYRAVTQLFRNLFLTFPLLGFVSFAGILTIAWAALRRRLHPSRKIYFFWFLLISVWLVLYYGSWEFSETTDPTHPPVLASSYFRYWLPIQVFVLPFAALFLLKMIRTFRRGKVLAIALFIGMFVTQAPIVFLDSTDGLQHIGEQQRDAQAIVQRVQEEIGSRALLITGKSDKIFFPEYPVLLTVPSSPERITILKKLAATFPVYYVQNDLEPSGDNDTLDRNGSLARVIDVNEHLTIFRFTPSL